MECQKNIKIKKNYINIKIKSKQIFVNAKNLSN